MRRKTAKLNMHLRLRREKRVKLLALRWIALLALLGLPACRPAVTPIPSPTGVSHPVNARTANPSTEPASNSTSKATPTSKPTTTPPWRNLHSARRTCPDTEGIFLDFSLPSQYLQDPLRGRVYFPPCYQEQSRDGYPVLYLLHGAAADEGQWDEIGVDETMETLLAEGRIPPFLIVMPHEPFQGLDPDDAFEDALLQELIPWVDGQFSTLESRTYRAIGGVSRGGNWALRIGFKHWRTFAAVGGHSAPVFYGDDGRIPRWLADIPEGQTPAIFLDIGMDDQDKKHTRALESLLTELGIPHTWHLYPGTHDEAYWHDHVPAYLLWYASHWMGD